MKNVSVNSHSSFIRKYTLLILGFGLLGIWSCKKSNNGPTIIPVDAGLVTDYGFMPGSYWIFQDSLTGNTDSAYVASYTTQDIYESCVLSSNTPKHTEINIIINVNNGNAADSETWQLTLLDSNASISFTSSLYNEENGIGYRLFTYPLTIGLVPEPVSCVMTADSGYVTNTRFNFAIGSTVYPNTVSIFQSQKTAISATYNDWFYLSPQAGFEKVVFNHPNSSIIFYRVLTLLRSHIVQNTGKL